MVQFAGGGACTFCDLNVRWLLIQAIDYDRFLCVVVGEGSIMTTGDRSGAEQVIRRMC